MLSALIRASKVVPPPSLYLLQLLFQVREGSGNGWGIADFESRANHFPLYSLAAAAAAVLQHPSRMLRKLVKNEKRAHVNAIYITDGFSLSLSIPVAVPSSRERRML